MRQHSLNNRRGAADYFARHPAADRQGGTNRTVLQQRQQVRRLEGNDTAVPAVMRKWSKRCNRVQPRTFDAGWE